MQQLCVPLVASHPAEVAMKFEIKNTTAQPLKRQRFMQSTLYLSFCLTSFLSVFLLVRSCLLVTLIKCPKGHKCVGSLCRLVKTLIVSSVRPRDQGTRSPIELFWTAKKKKLVRKYEHRLLFDLPQMGTVQK